MNRVAGQPVLTGQRGHMAIFQPAETAGSGNPDCAVLIESKLVNKPSAQPVGGSVRRADLPVLEIRHAAVKKSKPQATLQRIAGYSRSKVLMSQPGPGNFLDSTP